MPNSLRERLFESTPRRREIKSRLNVMIFGPYAGDCKYILRSIGEVLLKTHNIRADICEDAPVSKSLQRLSDRVSDDVYNFNASMECINNADYAVFLFLETKQRRFEPYGPFRESKLDMYDRPHYIPQDLNAANVIEFREWVRRGSPNPSRCVLIYEDSVDIALGSFVRGLVINHEIRPYSIETNSWGDAVKKLSSTIAGDFEAWITENEQMLLELIS